MSYKHIFFDLDHTLWDFNKNCAETLLELYQLYEFEKYDFTPQVFINEYQKVNHDLWKDYNVRKISKEDIRSKRFIYTFMNLGINPYLLPENISDEFLHRCPAKGNLFPYAIEVLSYLQKKYQLHIITNGFIESQHIKIKTSGLEPYFIEIINSEECGFSKPDKQIFEFAFQKANAVCHESIMIGDDLVADIKGAKNIGMDHIFFNPEKKEHQEELMYEISCLSELYEIL